MEPLTAEQHAGLAKLLLDEKRDLEERFSANAHFGLGESLAEGTSELSSYDNHPADVGTEMFERGKDLALNEEAEKEYRRVNDALERMEQGTYGTCVRCGQPIPYDRLEALPATSFCYEHSPEREVSNRRPIEEELLDPPFGRTSLDEKSKETEFDGEDAWQIVERWGSSNSPAFAENPEVDDYADMAVEADENVGYVEDLESFLATDIYGDNLQVIRNRAYRDYMQQEEGEPLLEPDAVQSEWD
ncbi:TraR/DksA C4-type zinc finger protein [Gorillibacterium timonense]|uniref:TraR/DksA C4-type zinc finger protein n=1 Tax=Gorillibacterium timonense TaxID=1689269 RepID=UPI00071CFD05|nr:TraR/DksA C4-type zinc finger protein [Gorillibacterium timonense]